MKEYTNLQTAWQACIWISGNSGIHISTIYILAIAYELVFEAYFDERRMEIKIDFEKLRGLVCGTLCIFELVIIYIFCVFR